MAGPREYDSVEQYLIESFQQRYEVVKESTKVYIRMYFTPSEDDDDKEIVEEYIEDLLENGMVLGVKSKRPSDEIKNANVAGQNFYEHSKHKRVYLYINIPNSGTVVPCKLSAKEVVLPVEQDEKANRMQNNECKSALAKNDDPEETVCIDVVVKSYADLNKVISKFFKDDAKNCQHQIIIINAHGSTKGMKPENEATHKSWASLVEEIAQLKLEAENLPPGCPRGNVTDVVLGACHSYLAKSNVPAKILVHPIATRTIPEPLCAYLVEIDKSGEPEVIRSICRPLNRKALSVQSRQNEEGKNKNKTDHTRVMEVGDVETVSGDVPRSPTSTSEETSRPLANLQNLHLYRK